MACTGVPGYQHGADPAFSSPYFTVVDAATQYDGVPAAGWVLPGIPDADPHLRDPLLVFPSFIMYFLCMCYFRLGV
jgi:hypothetical protein